jgi:hypothetical protein
LTTGTGAEETGFTIGGGGRGGSSGSKGYNAIDIYIVSLFIFFT